MFMQLFCFPAFFFGAWGYGAGFSLGYFRSNTSFPDATVPHQLFFFFLPSYFIRDIYGGERGTAVLLHHTVCCIFSLSYWYYFHLAGTFVTATVILVCHALSSLFTWAFCTYPPLGHLETGGGIFYEQFVPHEADFMQCLSSFHFFPHPVKLSFPAFLPCDVIPYHSLLFFSFFSPRLKLT